MSTDNPFGGSDDNDSSGGGSRIPDINITANTILSIISILFVLFLPTLIGGFFGSYLGPIFDIWFWRPKLHWLFYSVPHGFPVVMVYWIPAGIITLVGSAYDSDKLIVLATIILIVSLPVAFMSGIYVHEHLQDRADTDLQEREELPEMDAENPRIMPRSVARTYASNSMQYRKFRLSDQNDISFIDGKPYWSYALVPDTLPETYLGHQKGAVYVDMTTQRKSVKIEEQDMTYGLGVGVTDKLEFQLLKSDYMTEYRDPFMVTHENNNYIAVPKVTYIWKSKTIVPYTVPKFDGVALVHSDGTIEQLTPEEARNHPVLEGQNFYPYKLNRKEVTSLNWRKGFFNKIFTRENVFEVPDVPGRNNQQPFLVDTDEGLKYMMAVEPSGAGGGVFRLYFSDARTGQIEEMTLDDRAALTGPDRASNFVEQKLPRINWDSFHKSEPIPVFIDGNLHWMVKVVPNSNSGVSQIVFINASNTDDVVAVQTTEEVIEALKGEDIEGISKQQQVSEDTVVVIEIQSAEGTRKINVSENETVVIRPATNSSTAS